jgi:hypothetical protein
VLEAIVVMFERLLRIEWRINIDALDLAREFLPDSFQREKVVTTDQPVIENVVSGDAVRRMVGLLRVLDQDARLQLRPVFLADPG